MFNRIRQIHLFAAFVLTVFILMYFVSGFVMIFEESFERKDSSTERQVSVIPGIRMLEQDTLVAVVSLQTGARGQHVVRRNPTGTQILFRHPGIETAVVVPNHADSIQVTTRKKNAVATLHQFHRLHGYYGGWNYLLWAFFFDLSSLSMIVFAFTGVYLWFKNERVKWPGALILLATTLFIAFTIFYLQYLK